MWSVGITLFEAVTGRLPFNPKKGRQDRRTMYKMISAKQQGSAIEGEKGVEWSRELPQSCTIEKKDEVTRFLAGLLKVSRFYSFSPTICFRALVECRYMIIYFCQPIFC